MAVVRKFTQIAGSRKRFDERRWRNDRGVINSRDASTRSTPMRSLKIAALLLAFSSPVVAKPAAHPPANLGAAVANTAARTADNVKLDESRKPAEVLRFFGL